VKAQGGDGVGARREGHVKRPSDLAYAKKRRTLLRVRLGGCVLWFRCLSLQEFVMKIGYVPKQDRGSFSFLVVSGDADAKRAIEFLAKMDDGYLEIRWFDIPQKLLAAVGTLPNDFVQLALTAFGRGFHKGIELPNHEVAAVPAIVFGDDEFQTVEYVMGRAFVSAMRGGPLTTLLSTLNAEAQKLGSNVLVAAV
jgi:hypothetical protein